MGGLPLRLKVRKQNVLELRNICLALFELTKRTLANIASLIVDSK